VDVLLDVDEGVGAFVAPDVLGVFDLSFPPEAPVPSLLLGVLGVLLDSTLRESVR